jgi:four helix bundle protein
LKIPEVRGKMRIERFEDLAAWGRARELVGQVYVLTKKEKFCRGRVLLSQIRRAAISVMSNISEGFKRGSNREFIRFLYIAKGSCGEVRSQLVVAHDQDYLEEAEFQDTCILARRVSGTIENLIKYLSASDLRGPKLKMRRGKTTVGQGEAIPCGEEPPGQSDP